MPERVGRRRPPAIFREFISDLEGADLRNFERACESFHKMLEDILDTKSRPNGDGLRETEPLRIKSRKVAYDFWVAEEDTTVGEAKNIVLKARPVSDFIVADRVVLRADVNGKITNLLSSDPEPLDEDEYETVKQYTEMLKYMQENLPDPAAKARK